MAERPDLEYVVPLLQRALRGRAIVGTMVGKPVVLRVAVAGGMDGNVVGRFVRAVARRAHFVRFDLAPSAKGQADRCIVVAPMLAGRFVVLAPKLRHRRTRR